jgi:2,4-dienoyl-CoA reductase-like NADH-dependent reductase (Old Yellow Enzyme family)
MAYQGRSFRWRPRLPDLFSPLSFSRGPAMKNRFMLAPMTNLQSHADGRLSDDEFNWLTQRAKGGFGLTMTCAAQVQPVGQGFPGQLGAFSDAHLEGLARLAAAIKAEGSLAAMQLHHAGNRAPRELVGQPVCPSDDPETGARGLSTGEVEQLVEDFVAAAARADRAGFDGVELHGAHGYVIAQFLSPEVNRREDRYGGSLENRARIIFEIMDGVRSRCGPDFQLGLRLSPERFGLKLAEARQLAQAVMDDGRVDYIDMSLWDVVKEPEEPEFQGRSLMSYFTDLERGATRLGVAGKVATPAIAAHMLDQGADFVMIGRAAILHHDFPARARDDLAFEPIPLPASREHLRAEGVSPAFLEYLSAWKGFIADAA